MWNIALYIRLSREDAAQESLSVGNQRNLLRDYVKNFTEEYTIIDEYVDDGISGTDDRRPAFQRLLRDIEGGRINCVMVKDLARCFRNYADQGYFLEVFFPRHNVRFISVQLPFVDSHAHPETYDSILLPIQGVINDNLCRETSQKVRAIFQMKRRNGEFIGAFAPYGYVKDPKNKNHLVPDTEAAAVVREIYHMFTECGRNKTAIARHLQACGIPAPSAYKRQQGLSYYNPHDSLQQSSWTAQTVSYILHNEVYCGTLVQGRYRMKSYKVHQQVLVPRSEWVAVPDAHAAIISPELFARAQALQQRNIRTPPQQREGYMFSGLLFCANCRRAMHRKRAQQYVYYSCRNAAASAACKGHSIREDRLQQAVQIAMQQAAQKLCTPQTMQAEWAKRKQKSSPKRLEVRQQERWQAERERLRRCIDALYPDWKNGEITREEYHRMKADYTTRLAFLTQELQRMQKNSDRKQAEDTYAQNWIMTGALPELSAGLLHACIEEILVRKNKEIDVFFRFSEVDAETRQG